MGNFKAGDVLAEIDPRTFAAQLAQVEGQAEQSQQISLKSE